MKKNLILDLDNTILSSVELKKIKKIPHNNLEYIDMDTDFRVFLRPHIKEFLNYIFKHFKISVWTAASKDYALFIINNIILKDRNEDGTKRKLDFIFFDYHGKVSENKYEHPKKLEILWKFYNFPGYNKHNTVIIDDNKYVHTRQKNNIIKAIYFDAEKPHADDDTFMLDVLPILDKFLKKNCQEYCT